MDEKHALIYLVWQEPEDPATDTGYWSQYDCLVSAINTNPGHEVYTARPRKLGRFKYVNKLVRIKPRKKKR